MAFTLFRQSARCSKLIEKSLSVGLRNTKLDPTRNLVSTCECAALVGTLGAQNQIQTRDYSKRAKHHTSKKYDSDCSSDSDWEVLSHRGESEFWRRKMRTFHGILDVNKDGVISYDDFVLLADRFINLGYLTEKQTQAFRDVIKNIWERQWGEVTPYNLVTIEQYLEDMRHVLNNKDRFKRTFVFLSYLFKAIDKDNSGEISVKEFILFFKCLDLSDSDAILAFRTIDTNGDGKVTYKEFIQHGKEFFITEDENNISKFFWGPLVEH